MKKTILLFTVLILSVCLFSCSSEKEIDVGSLADRIFDSDPFSEEMVTRNPTDYQTVFGFSVPLEFSMAYAGGGATAEEIFIAKAETVDGAKEIKSAFSSYLTSQIKSFTSYNPAEVSKLESAVLIQKGAYVIYCVSNTDVSGLVNEYFG